MKPERHLVLGGARSGKTRHALQLAVSLERASGAEVLYVATAEPGDTEMEQRIARHRQERPAHWRTVEVPRQLGKALAELPPKAVVIVDCLTLWLSSSLLRDFRDDAPLAALPTWNTECAEFMSYLAHSRHSIVLVSNEVGGGIVPLAPVARRFQSEQGWLNQAVAAACERVTLTVAGIALQVKPGGIPVGAS